MRAWSFAGRPAIILGIGAGLVYGIVARLAFSRPRLGLLFSSMTYGFIFFVPFAVGYVTVAPIESRTWTQRLLLPWLTSVLLLGTAALVGWEGSLCLVLAAPAVLVSSSVGGLLAAAVRGGGRARQAGAAMILGLPFVVAPLENRAGVEPAVRTVETSIRIHASASAVWSEIVQVPAIGREEFLPRLIHRALDEHVEIGGEQFDVLEGRYELEARAGAP